MTGDTVDHEHIAALLPWLANGTLEGDERERVERHVRHCLPCRAELAAQTRLMALVQRQPVVPLSADEGFERLRARLDRRPRRGSRAMRRTFLALAAAAAAAAIGLPIATSLLGSGETRQPDEYRTLSDAGASAALIDVIFADGVRESEMRALLDELNAEIVAGPSPGLGRYTLRLRSLEGARDPAPVVRRLLDDARIRFAGPTFAPPRGLSGGAASAEDAG